MTQTELIKQEIERRRCKAELGKMEAQGVSAITYNMHLAEENLCMFLLSFIESLEKEKSEIPTIKGWAARDKSGIIFISQVKPIRCVNSPCWLASRGLTVKTTDFPDLKWEDEPIEVELIIRKV